MMLGGDLKIDEDDGEAAREEEGKEDEEESSSPETLVGISAMPHG